jgi:hypothetical protein
MLGGFFGNHVGEFFIRNSSPHGTPSVAIL